MKLQEVNTLKKIPIYIYVLLNIFVHKGCPHFVVGTSKMYTRKKYYLVYKRHCRLQNKQESLVIDIKTYITLLTEVGFENQSITIPM